MTSETTTTTPVGAIPAQPGPMDVTDAGMGREREQAPSEVIAGAGPVVRPGERATVAFETDLEPGLVMDVDRHAMLQALQNLLQSHISNHEAADLLEQPQLLFDALEAAFEVLCLRHGFHYSVKFA